MEGKRLTTCNPLWVGERYGRVFAKLCFFEEVELHFSSFMVLHDMFDLPLHMARDQIEESLRTKMASIKVEYADFHAIRRQLFCDLMVKSLRNHCLYSMF